MNFVAICSFIVTLFFTISIYNLNKRISALEKKIKELE